MKGHFRRKLLSKSPYSEILKFARKSRNGRKFSILVKTRNKVATIVSFQSDRGVYNSCLRFTFVKYMVKKQRFTNVYSKFFDVLFSNWQIFRFVLMWLQLYLSDKYKCMYYNMHQLFRCLISIKSSLKGHNQNLRFINRRTIMQKCEYICKY